MKPTLLLLCLLAGCSKKMPRTYDYPVSNPISIAFQTYFSSNQIVQINRTFLVEFHNIKPTDKSNGLGFDLDFNNPTNIEMRSRLLPYLCGASNGFYIVRFATNTVH